MQAGPASTSRSFRPCASVAVIEAAHLPVVIKTSLWQGRHNGLSQPAMPRFPLFGKQSLDVAEAVAALDARIRCAQPKPNAS